MIENGDSIDKDKMESKLSELLEEIKTLLIEFEV
jgi:hypothetical protein